jgi:AcrR family transcriptional regulator
VVSKTGVVHLSARNVAQELGSSTAPVYSNFASMEELENEVFRLAGRKFLDFTRVQYTDNPFLNMGIGVLHFARECPHWYFAMGTQERVARFSMQNVLDSMLDDLDQVEQLQGVDPRERRVLLHKMGTFTHGLAWDICTRSVTDQEMEGVVLLLREVGAVLTKDAQERPARTDEEYQKLEEYFQFLHGCAPDPGDQPEDSNGQSQPSQKDEDHE